MRADTRSLAIDAGLLAYIEEITGRGSDPLRLDGGIEEGVWDAALLGPARDILSRPGKGFRARLVERAWRLAGGSPAGPPPLLEHAIELLHVGSLVIDDIEDDSRLRRGRPALHREHGVPIALNTGNWLCSLALAILARLPVGSARRAALYEDMTVALVRCHHGQALDLSVRVTSVPRAQVPTLVSVATRLKTGSLMHLAARVGAHAAGAGPDVVDAIGRFGSELGVGLQMLDDWSGIGVAARRDKGLEDIKLARLTWPWAWLAESDDELAYAETVRQARAISIDWEADRVRERLRGLVCRSAPARIRARLDTAMDGLRTTLGDSAELAALGEEVDELEQAFGGT